MVELITKTFKNLNLLLNSSQKKGFYLIVISNLITTTLEMLSLSLIPIAIGVLLKTEEYKNYLPEMYLIQGFLEKSNIEKFTILSIGIIIIFLVKNLFAFITIFFEGKFLRNIKVHNAKKLYNIYINLLYLHLLAVNHLCNL